MADAQQISVAEADEVKTTVSESFRAEKLFVVCRIPDVCYRERVCTAFHQPVPATASECCNTSCSLKRKRLQPIHPVKYTGRRVLTYVTGQLYYCAWSPELPEVIRLKLRDELEKALSSVLLPLLTQGKDLSASGRVCCCQRLANLTLKRTVVMRSSGYNALIKVVGDTSGLQLLHVDVSL